MKPILVFLFCAFASILHAQDPRLADQYFQTGEYEKAATIYEKLQNTNGGDFYFDRYINCLTQLDRFEEAEKVLNKQIKKEPSRTNLLVTLGGIFDQQNKNDKAQEQYLRAIEKLSGDRFSIDNLASSFTNLSKFDLAIATYERGAKLLKNKNIFAFQLAELYRRKGDNVKMIESYLNTLQINPEYLPSVQTMLQRSLEKAEDYEELQSQLYARLQDSPNNAAYIETMAWLYVQKKDYKNAFRQLKALDKMTDDNGNRVFNLASVAEQSRDYDAAIDGYTYIVQEKGATNGFYFDAKRGSLACKRRKLTDGYAFTEAELKGIETEYETFLTEQGYSRNTATIIAELADLEAFYLKNVDKAIKLLTDLIETPQGDPQIRAKAKLSLGDFYLIKGENWESSLLYSQVDKAYKDDVLGHEARFRNAKLSYYTGNFDWAKAQFKVLKSSTSKLIANDAIDMDVFIMDNTGLDSTTTAMGLYADAELLVFQNRFAEAFLKMDTILTDFPKHSLDDDVLYLKAKIYVQQRDYPQAVAAYNKIIAEHADEIRADNALFELAGLYEGALNDKEKAKTLYEKLFTDFSNSTLAVEARKKFRLLRGDNL